MKKNIKPESLNFELVKVERSWGQICKEGLLWILRLSFLCLTVAIGIQVAENQRVLSDIAKTVEGLRRSLGLDDKESSVMKVLDQKAGKKMSKLEKIKITRLIASNEINGVDADFTLDLIRRESTFNPYAVSATGAVGLMQLLPSTAKWLAEKERLLWEGSETLFDPVKNVELGTAYLAYLARDFDNKDSLRAAYQIGPNKVKRILKKGGKYVGNP